MGTARNSNKSRLVLGVQSAIGTTATAFGTEHPLLEGGGQLVYTYENEDDRSISQVGAPETDVEDEASAGTLDFYGDHNKGDRLFHAFFGTTEQQANGTIFEKYYTVNSDGGKPLTVRKYIGDTLEQYEDVLPDVFTYTHDAGKAAEFSMDFIGAKPTVSQDTSANSIATRTKLKGSQVLEHNCFGEDVLNLVKRVQIVARHNYDRADFHLGPLNRGEPAAGDFDVEIQLDMRWVDEVFDISQSVGSRGILEALTDRSIGTWEYRLDNGLSADSRRATYFIAKRVQVLGDPITGDTSGDLPATIRLKALDASIAVDDIDLLGTGAGTGNHNTADNCPLAMGRLNGADTTGY